MRFSSEYFHFNDKKFEYIQFSCMDTGRKPPFGRLSHNGSTPKWFHTFTLGVIFNSNFPHALVVLGQRYFIPALSSSLLHNVLHLLAIDFSYRRMICTFKPSSIYMVEISSLKWKAINPLSMVDSSL